MKTRSRQSGREFELKLLPYGNYYYIERIPQLEAVLAKRPRSVRINMVGVGEIPADTALLIRSVLLKRPPRTRIITNARNSLQGGSVLVWLLGERRIIRDDARLFLRDADLSDDEAGPDATNRNPAYRDSFSEIEPEEGDYARVLELINEFLPVKELAGKFIEMPVLRQFGLVENEQVDDFLAAAFGKKHGPVRNSRSRPQKKRLRFDAKPARSRQVGK